MGASANTSSNALLPMLQLLEKDELLDKDCVDNVELEAVRLRS